MSAAKNHLGSTLSLNRRDSAASLATIGLRLRPGKGSAMSNSSRQTLALREKTEDELDKCEIGQTNENGQNRDSDEPITSSNGNNNTLGPRSDVLPNINVTSE